MDLFIRLQAKFAAYRYFQTGKYRATAPVITPSAAYGLLLNLAQVEMRGDTTYFGKAAITTIHEDIPFLELAVGTIKYGQIGTLYQRLHSYVQDSGGQKKEKELGHGQKVLIKMAKREVLTELDCVIAVRNLDTFIAERIQKGLNGEYNSDRYGLPFAGDNNFLFNKIELLDSPPETTWYTRTKNDNIPRRGSCLLTAGINRVDSSKTTSFVYAPIENPQISPPDDDEQTAWTWIPRKPD